MHDSEWVQIFSPTCRYYWSDTNSSLVSSLQTDWPDRLTTDSRLTDWQTDRSFWDALVLYCYVGSGTHHTDNSREERDIWTSREVASRWRTEHKMTWKGPCVSHHHHYSAAQSLGGLIGWNYWVLNQIHRQNEHWLLIIHTIMACRWNSQA